MPGPESAPAPGWYRDPLGATSQRWWDGTRWTTDVRNVTPDRADHHGAVPPGGHPTEVIAAQNPTTQRPTVPSARPHAPGVTATTPAAGGSDVPTPPAHSQAGRATAPVSPKRGPRTAFVVIAIVLLAAVATGGFLLGTQRSTTDGEADTAAVGNTSPQPEPAPSPGDDPAADEQTTLSEETSGDTTADPGRADGAGGDNRASTATDNSAAQAPPPSEQAPMENGSQAAEDTSVPTSSLELAGTVERYVGALDRGDLTGAHDMLAPELVSRAGWSLQEFVDFWEGYLVGAVLLEVIETDEARQQVTAQVDFALTGDGLSREVITLTMRASDGGAIMISDYEVVRADRLR